jgi:hypothetical protein
MQAIGSLVERGGDLSNTNLIYAPIAVLNILFQHEPDEITYLATEVVLMGAQIVLGPPPTPQLIIGSSETGSTNNNTSSRKNRGSDSTSSSKFRVSLRLC